MAIPHFHIDERRRTRSLAPIAICCLGLLVTLAAGALDHQRLRSADRQQQAIAAGVAVIASRLDTRTPTPAAAPDPALTAAEARVRQQDEELARLRRQAQRPAYLPPNPDVLYKGDVPMAVVEQPVIDAAAKRVRFKLVLAHGDLDMTTPFLFRRWSLDCAPARHAGVIAGGLDHVKYWDLPCRIAP